MSYCVCVCSNLTQERILAEMFDIKLVRAWTESQSLFLSVFTCFWVVHLAQNGSFGACLFLSVLLAFESNWMHSTMFFRRSTLLLSWWWLLLPYAICSLREAILARWVCIQSCILSCENHLHIPLLVISYFTFSFIVKLIIWSNLTYLIIIKMAKT